MTVITITFLASLRVFSRASSWLTELEWSTSFAFKSSSIDCKINVNCEYCESLYRAKSNSRKQTKPVVFLHFYLHSFSDDKNKCYFYRSSKKRVEVSGDSINLCSTSYILCWRSVGCSGRLVYFYHPETTLEN